MTLTLLKWFPTKLCALTVALIILFGNISPSMTDKRQTVAFGILIIMKKRLLKLARSPNLLRKLTA